jgi:hypothetical protein
MTTAYLGDPAAIGAIIRHIEPRLEELAPKFNERKYPPVELARLRRVFARPEDVGNPDTLTRWFGSTDIPERRSTQDARSRSLLEEVKSDIARNGGTCHLAPCDLREPHEVEGAVRKLIDELGGLYALINNAGLVVRKDIFTLSLDEWRAMLETRAHRPQHCASCRKKHHRSVVPFALTFNNTVD